MLERLHDHMVVEVGHSNRTDTIFIVVSVFFNLIVLGINSATAGPDGRRLASDIVLAVFIVMTILVNVIAVAGLRVGRQTRRKLVEGLIAMYTDNSVDKYYDKSLVSNYGTRYSLFGAVIIILALTAIVVPLVLRLL